MKPYVSNLLIGLAAFALWLHLTLIGWVIYLVLSVILNHGHPWPYEPWLLFGVIPAGIGICVASGLYAVWRIVK